MAPRTKICVLGPAPPLRGAIPQITLMMTRALAKEYDLTFLTIKRGYPLFLYPGRDNLDKTQAGLSFRRSISSLTFINPLSWILTAGRIIRRRPDILIIPWWVVAWALQFWTVAFLVRSFSSTKIMFDCHNVEEHESGTIRNALARMVLNLGHYLVVHSQAEKRKARSIFKRKPVFVVMLPTFDFIKPSGLSKGQIRKKMGLGGKTILFFGFVRPYKGLAYLLKAMVLLKGRIDLTLVVAGEIWEDKEDYLKMIEEGGIKDQVLLVDRYIRYNEIADFFAAADLVVLPYVSGTGSAVTKVAYAMRVPVLGTRAADLPETIEQGRTGFLVAKKDPGALATAIVDFYRLGNHAALRKNILRKSKEFSWDNYLEVLRRLV